MASLRNGEPGGDENRDRSERDLKTVWDESVPP